jgi:hypothetical protein
MFSNASRPLPVNFSVTTYWLPPKLWVSRTLRASVTSEPESCGLYWKR